MPSAPTRRASGGPTSAATITPATVDGRRCAILLLVGVLFTLIGGCFVVFGRRRWARSRQWPRVTGTVTGVSTHLDGEPGSMSTHSPIVAFVVDGRTVHAESSASDNIHSYRIGRTLPVRYDPERPERAIVDIVGQNGVMHQAVGVVITLAGVAILVGVATHT
jgi:Protein of unknown function (DUF3592)